jgi:TolB protein
MTFLTGVLTPSLCSAVMVSRRSVWRALLLMSAAAGMAAAREGDLGQFTEHTDIGAPQHAGTVVHDPATGTYTISGGGMNMWFRKDSFHYVWKKVEGDTALTADLAFQSTGGDPHRKGILMIRQSLDADAAYVDVAVHGDGLTSLQYRETGGDITHEVQATRKAPKRVRLEKVGDYVSMSLAGDDGVLQPSGSSARVEFKPPFYIGLGVCAHNDAVAETVFFSQVTFSAPAAEATAVRSSLEYVKTPPGERVCVYPSRESITAAGWAAGGALHFAQKSGSFRVPAFGGPAEAADSAVITAQATAASPDGKWTAALEHHDDEAVLTLRPTAGGDARVLMRLPDQGRAPRTISWSPDSTKIAYVRYQPASPVK